MEAAACLSDSCGYMRQSENVKGSCRGDSSGGTRGCRGESRGDSRGNSSSVSRGKSSDSETNLVKVNEPKTLVIKVDYFSLTLHRILRLDTAVYSSERFGCLHFACMSYTISYYTIPICTCCYNLPNSFNPCLKIRCATVINRCEEIEDLRTKRLVGLKAFKEGKTADAD